MRIQGLFSQTITITITLDISRECLISHNSSQGPILGGSSMGLVSFLRLHSSLVLQVSISNQYASPLMDKRNAAVGFLWRGGHINSHTHKCRRPLFSAAHCFVRSGFWLGDLSFCKTSLRSKDSNEYLLELWNRILKSLIKVRCPSRFKSFFEFLTGRKPLLLWSFWDASHLCRISGSRVISV